MSILTALSALFLHFPHSGTGRYLSELAARVINQTDLILIGAAAYPPADGQPLPIMIRTPFDSRSRRIAKIWFEQVALPAAACRLGAAVVHIPYFAAPLRPRRPTVVTVHDLVPLIRPEYRRTAAQRLYTALVARGLQSARRIITDSSASAQDLESLLGIAPSRIRIIPLGVDSRFQPLATRTDHALADRVLADHGIDRPYFLYLGGLDQRKNVALLVRAFHRLKRETNLPHLLVIAGAIRSADDLFYDPRPDLQRLGLVEDTRLPGPVTDVEARALLARATAFVFPSLYEGFGLPPLEAMACGTPVICSNASSLPEVVGDAGLLFDPRDEAALTAHLARLARDAELRRELGTRGRERATHFTWERTVAATIAVWEEVASGL
ncbi:MAG TPA: glycosyltransferase family 1 protein [Chloroflexota bacterium]|nr:glycosyltransferase family 1 protein [Chloroflexota bacterium]